MPRLLNCLVLSAAADTLLLVAQAGLRRKSSAALASVLSLLRRLPSLYLSAAVAVHRRSREQRLTAASLPQRAGCVAARALMSPAVPLAVTV